MIPGKNVHGFSVDLKKFSELIGVEHSKVMQRAVYKVWQGVISRSPVLTGQFRASWGVSRDEVPNDSGEPPADKVPVSNANARYNPQDFLGSYYHIWWVYNNLPYAVPLEEGHSRQAPSGIVSPALADAYAEIQVEIDRRTR